MHSEVLRAMTGAPLAEHSRTFAAQRAESWVAAERLHETFVGAHEQGRGIEIHRLANVG